MTLEFDKLVPQIQEMGKFAAYRSEDIHQRGERALALLEGANDLDEIWRKIELARANDAGYRGAAPLEGLINAYHAEPLPPERATILAVDGSQVYPDPHASALYYLTNIGIFIFHHGVDELAEQISEPQLFFNDVDIRDVQGQLIKHAAINARRTVQEAQGLAHLCFERRYLEAPMLALMDGPLLFWLGKDVPQAEKLEHDYHEAIMHIHTTHQFLQTLGGHRATLAGYVDTHDSRFVIRLLQLLTLEDEQVRRSVLDNLGDFEGLTDDFLFRNWLEAGERSAIMIQQSPQNKSYKYDVGDDYEIAFFYLNVGDELSPHIVRVEIPMWVARSPEAVQDAHALLLQQCRIMGRYPYCLTRADELAVVRGHEKQHLEEMINIELLRNRQPVEKSPKQLGKDQARASRRRYGQPTF